MPPETPAGRLALRLIPPLLLLALLLWPLGTRGIRVHDEGHFLLGASTVAQGIAGILAGRSPAEIAGQIHATGGTLYFTAKPGFVLLLAAWGLLTGGLTVLKAQILVTLMALGAVALLQAAAARLRNETAGLLAGVLLAVTPLMTVFGAAVLGAIPVVFFLCLALWLTVQERRALLCALLAGVALTAAVSCHYSAAAAVPAYLLWWWHRARWRGLGAIAAGGIGSALLLEAGLLAAGLVLRNAYPEFKSWTGELLHAFVGSQLQTDQAVPVESLPPEARDGAWGYGARAWAELARIAALGILPPLAAGIGGAALIRKLPADKTFSPAAVLLLAFLPLAVWSLYPWKVERVFSTALPGLALCGGLGLAAVSRRQIRNAVAGLLVTTGVGLVILVRYEDAANPWRDASAAGPLLIEDAPEGTFTASSFPWRTAPLWKWYLGNERLNRGLAAPGVDFASFDAPLIAVRDRWSSLPGGEAYILKSGPVSYFEHPLFAWQPSTNNDADAVVFLARDAATHARLSALSDSNVQDEAVPAP